MVGALLIVNVAGNDGGDGLGEAELGLYERRERSLRVAHVAHRIVGVHLKRSE